MYVQFFVMMTSEFVERQPDGNRLVELETSEYDGRRIKTWSEKYQKVSSSTQ